MLGVINRRPKKDTDKDETKKWSFAIFMNLEHISLYQIIN
jgi:hypothetical protein